MQASFVYLKISGQLVTPQAFLPPHPQECLATCTPAATHTRSLNVLEMPLSSYTSQTHLRGCAHHNVEQLTETLL